MVRSRDVCAMDELAARTEERRQIGGNLAV